MADNGGRIRGVGTGVAAAAVLLAGCGAPALGQTTVPGKHPAILLLSSAEKGATSVMVYLPDAKDGYYRGPRFDWSGMIGKVEYKGHSFYADWRVPQNPKGNDDAIGPAEEFGMQEPVGWSEAKVGETFLKIGVGRQKKTSDKAYEFWTNYPVVALYPFKVTGGLRWAEFRQEAPVEGGYGYAYTKRVELAADKPVVTITHTLKNTGTLALKTNWYSHNFTLIDGDGVGPDYEMEFGFDAKDGFKADSAAVVKQEGRKVTFLATPDGLKGSFGGGKAAENKVTVRNKKTGAGIEMTVDRDFSNMAFFAVKTAICPEPFIELNVAPGEETTWKSQYTYLVP